MAGQKQVEKKRKLGWQYYTGVGVMVATAAALVAMKSCKPEPEGPQTECPKVAAVEKKAPVNGDGKCEIEKGEHDPLAATGIYSESDCGYCGDRIPQDHENATFCEIDFKCGDGELQKKPVKLAAMIKEGEGSEAVYSYGIIEYTESCDKNAKNYCAADCGEEPAPKTTQRVPGPLPQQPERPAAPVAEEKPTLPKGQCGSIGDSQVLGRLASSMQSGGGAIRSQSGASGVPILAYFTVSYAPGRGPQLGGSYIKCAGKKCPNSVSPAAAAGVNLQGAQVTGVTQSCSKTYTLPVQ